MVAGKTWWQQSTLDSQSACWSCEETWGFGGGSPYMMCPPKMFRGCTSSEVGAEKIMAPNAAMLLMNMTGGVMSTRGVEPQSSHHPATSACVQSITNVHYSCIMYARTEEELIVLKAGVLHQRLYICNGAHGEERAHRREQGEP